MLADRFPPRCAGFSVAILDNVTLDARRLHPYAEAGEGSELRRPVGCLDVGARRSIKSGSEAHLVTAFKRQHHPRLVGRGDLEAKAFDDPAHVYHLRDIRLREFSRT